MKSLCCFHISQGHYCWPTEKWQGIRVAMVGGLSCRQCLGAEKGRGRGEGAGLAPGGKETFLLCQVPERHTRAPELRERDDIGLVCSLVWACEKVSLFTLFYLAVALFWATDKSCGENPHLALCSTKALQPPHAFNNVVFQSSQGTLTLPCVSYYFIYFRAWFQTLKAQSLLSAFICNSQARMTSFVLDKQHGYSGKQMYKSYSFT